MKIRKIGLPLSVLSQLFAILGLFHYTVAFNVLNPNPLSEPFKQAALVSRRDSFVAAISSVTAFAVLNPAPAFASTNVIKTLDMSLPTYNEISNPKASVETVDSLSAPIKGNKAPPPKKGPNAAPGRKEKKTKPKPAASTSVKYEF